MLIMCGQCHKSVENMVITLKIMFRNLLFGLALRNLRRRIAEMARELEDIPSLLNMTLLHVHITKALAVLAILVALPNNSDAQQNISGVVNQYVQVTDVLPCDSLLIVGNPANFVAGDKVLIIQMKGAQIKTDNDDTFGTFTNMNWAGCAEFLKITRIDGDKFYFGSKLVHKYDPAGNVQLVKVAVYQSAKVTGDVLARPWNGSIGGVIAIEVAEDLTLNANITANGQGFRGGVVSIPISKCNVTTQMSSWTFGHAGAKGEGIVSLPVPYQPAGRGALGNGGGGGNGNNGGGAGGGNGGEGGDGGSANKQCSVPYKVGGRPGKAVDSLVQKQRFYMGGGGGGGHQNDTLGSSGGNGGGIVFVFAKTIISNEFIISADGESVTEDADWDGAGGGGAGGTIFIDARNVTGNLNVSARGGNGGDIIHQFNAHGPGGGGGGGVIVFKQPTSNVIASVAPGTNGIHTNPTNEVYLEAWDATPGQPGAIFNWFNWKTPADLILTAWGGGPICPGESQELRASDGYMLYEWSNGSTQQFTTVNTPGTYSVKTTDSSGCVYTFGGLRVWDNEAQFTLTSALDFGTVDYKRLYTKTLFIENNDDDVLVVESITSSQSFIVKQPSAFPVMIPPGQKLPVVVEFFANEDRPYSEEIQVAMSAPCPTSRTISITAVVNPIKISVFLPDTSANTGDLEFPITIRCTLVPDTLTLPATRMRITVRFDSKLFAPKSVSLGRVVTDNIDLIAQKRTITIEIDSIDLHGSNMTITQFRGTVLSAIVRESPLELVSVDWIKVWQAPRTTVLDGKLTVSDVCFQKGRVIKLFSLPRLTISPNPVADVLTTDIVVSAPGAYSVKIIDMQGNEVYVQNFQHNSDSEQDFSEQISTSSWSQGLYFVVYNTPLLTSTQQIVVQR